MNKLAEKHLKALEAVVAEAQRLMELGGWREAEEQLAPALASFENAGLILEPQHEWLRLQSLHAECLFWRGEFERAESVFEAASHSRKEAGIFDWQFIRQRRYVALSKRGLCDFSGCQTVLAEARSVASQNHLTEVIPRLDTDITTTEQIRQGTFHDVAFAAQNIRLVGRNGVEILGDDRIPLQGCESLNYACKVSECCFGCRIGSGTN
jgi:tetratricopeptide (TPR) repeat protein